MNSKLALYGGEKVIKNSAPSFNTYDEKEKEAVLEVLESKVLSRFLGAWGEDFFGGPQVQNFEKEWALFFGIEYAVSVNSATSGLIAAIGAIGISPGDEVLVSPWTMSATATAILVWNAIPVFVDIDQDTYNLNPDLIEKNISEKTKAIVVTDIFGHPANFNEILKIARKYNLKVIEDGAQAPGAMYHGKYAGTLADIGVYSLNYHKHIHTGEGGICVTNDPNLCERMQLIRNHAEAVVAKKQQHNMDNLIGFNFRLGEIEAAIGRQQLKKLTSIVEKKQNLAMRLSAGLQVLEGLRTPTILPNCTHAFYVYPLEIDISKVGVTREKIYMALEAEGVQGLIQGYINLHLLPMYQNKIAYGQMGYPWKMPGSYSNVSYSKGICPVAEELHDKTFLGILWCAHDFDEQYVDFLTMVFHKIWDELSNLK